MIVRGVKRGMLTEKSHAFYVCVHVHVHVCMCTCAWRTYESMIQCICFAVSARKKQKERR